MEAVNMPISDLQTLLRSMRPVLNAGVYVFTSLPKDAVIDPRIVVASINEPEGLSLVIAEADAIEYKLPYSFRAAWITLTVHSDLEALGFTAAFATALGEAGISCNVVAGTHHDHIFVPFSQAQDALSALLRLQ
jgi:hypothetical protein